MLSHQEVEHYRTFGYIVLPHFFNEATTAQLRADVADATRQSEWASLMSHPSACLVADDDRLQRVAQQLLAARTIPLPAQAARLHGDGGWHFDDAGGVRGVSFAAYLEGSGALHFVPGSQSSDHRQAVGAFAAAFHDQGLPSVAAPTVPGDLIAFHLQVWHAYFGAGGRLAWFSEFLAMPKDSAEREVARDRLREWANDWRAWPDNPAGNENRANALIRLRLAGAFD